MGNIDYKGKYGNKDKESPYKMEYEANINYKTVRSKIKYFKKNLKYKIFNSTRDYKFDSLGNKKAVDIITEPIYICFSWRDKFDNRYSYPISFHMPLNKFNKELDYFIKSILD